MIFNFWISGGHFMFWSALATRSSVTESTTRETVDLSKPRVSPITCSCGPTGIKSQGYHYLLLNTQGCPLGCGSFQNYLSVHSPGNQQFLYQSETAASAAHHLQSMIRGSVPLKCLSCLTLGILNAALAAIFNRMIKI